MHTETRTLRPDGYSDGMTWCCGYLGGAGNKIWRVGGRTEALRLFAQYRVSLTVGEIPRYLGMCNRVDIGPRFWSRTANRWYIEAADTVNDVSYARGAETGGDDYAAVAAQTSPLNDVCAGPYAEDLCQDFPPVDLRVVTIETDVTGAGWYGLAMRAPAESAGLFVPGGIQGVLVQTMPDNVSYLYFAGMSTDTAIDFAAADNRVVPIATAYGATTGTQHTVAGVPPWQDGTAGHTAINWPDGYTLAGAFYLLAQGNVAPASFYAKLNADSDLIGPHLQMTGGNSLRVRTYYGADDDGADIWADDWVITNGITAPGAAQSAAAAPLAPTGLALTDISTQREAPVIQPADYLLGVPPTSTSVWLHRVRADWTPPLADRQRVFVAVDVPSYLSYDYSPYVPDAVYGLLYGGIQSYVAHADTQTARLTSRTYNLPGAANHLEFDVPPGSTVKLYVRGENGLDTNPAPGEAARGTLVMPTHGQEDPISAYLSPVPTPITGEDLL